MRILVFEYETGGGLLGKPLHPALVQEGELMLHALLRDLVELQEIEILSLRDGRLPRLAFPAKVRQLYHSRELGAQFKRGLAECDAVWPVAPDSNGTLERLSIETLEHHRVLIGSRPDAIAVAASVLRTARTLERHGIPVVPAVSGADVLAGAALQDPPWLVKPDAGTSYTGARLVRGERELLEFLQQSRNAEELVVQPYVVGTHASLSVLAGNGMCQLLACNAQRMVVVNDEFRLARCVVNGIQSDRLQFEELARAVSSVLPGLWGYFGIDLMLTEAGPRILGVSARLNTCYAGITHALDLNVAGVVLGLLKDNAQAPHITQSAQTVALDMEAVDFA